VAELPPRPPNDLLASLLLGRHSCADGDLLNLIRGVSDATGARAHIETVQVYRTGWTLADSPVPLSWLAIHTSGSIAGRKLLDSAVPARMRFRLLP